jgi:TorA maturation chaperone TorD
MLETEFALDAPARSRADAEATPPDAEEYRARAGVCRLLAGAFAEEPSAAFLDACRREPLLGLLAQAGIEFDADFLEPALPQLEDTLGCEYATLFVACGGFPPVESVRLTGRLKQEPAHHTAETYRRLGFAVGKSRFEVFADHLGVELDFVAELLERCAAAIDAGDAARQRELDKEVRRFWTLHLGRWVRGYGRLIERMAGHSFYRGMARLLTGFAEEEIAAMGLKRVEDLDQARAVVPQAEVPVEVDPNEPVCAACPGGGIQPAGAPRVAPITVHRLNDLRL